MRIEGLDLVWGGSRISILLIGIIILVIGIVTGYIIGDRSKKRNASDSKINYRKFAVLFLFGVPLLATLIIGTKEFISAGIESEKFASYKAGYNDGLNRNVLEEESNTHVYTFVYITGSGEKYHRSDCRYVNDSSKRLSLEDAIDRGYTPCSVCNPPRP